MQDERNYVANIERAISKARLGAYRYPSDTSDLDAIARYLWNAALSETLYPSLQALEVTLRNSLHETISDQFTDTMWFAHRPPILHSMELDKVDAAKRELRSERKPLEPGRLVAELNFGFWTSLLDVRYERVLWPGLLKQAFPTMPRHIRTRHMLSKRLNSVRKLRNRVFHHESIYNASSPGLQTRHDQILEMIGWISPEMRDTVSLIERFPDVYAQGIAFYRHMLERHLGEHP